MLRSLTANPVAVATLCGFSTLVLFLLHAAVAFGENVFESYLTTEEDTLSTLWAVFYGLGGLCLLVAVPVLTYVGYGVVTPAVVLAVLSAGYLYSVDSKVVYMFLFYTPQFVSVLFAVGTVEYALRAALLDSVSLSSGLGTGLALGVAHATVAVVVADELSLLSVSLSLGAVYVVAVPTVSILQFGAVGPAFGAVTGLVAVFWTRRERLPTEYSFLSTQLLVPIFLFGGIEYLLRSTNVVGG